MEGRYRLSSCLWDDACSEYRQRHSVHSLPFQLYRYVHLWAAVLLFRPADEAQKRSAAISNGASAIFCAYALGYGMMSSHLSLAAIRFFSVSAFFYKVVSAFYLLITAVLAIHEGRKLSRVIFYATVIFVVAAIGYSLWHDVVEGYGNSLIFQEKQKQGARRILVVGWTRGSMYFLKVENTYDGQTLQKGNLFLSRKGASPYHGIGLSSVRKIIEAHGGYLDIVPCEESFLVGITLGL